MATSAHPIQRVHAVVPWALLESIRSVDAPPEDGMDEFHNELAVKRLGTSRTVAAQIERFRDLVRRGARVDADEIVALLKLVGRRSDAALVFTDAGRRAAGWVRSRVGVPHRLLWRLLPRQLRHRYGLRIARIVLERFFGLRVSKDAGRTAVHALRPPSVDATPDGSACKFYGSAIGALLEAYTSFDGAMIHDACAARGSDQCRWVAGGPAGA